MTIVAIIPARGGSKGVPGKNLREVGGVSLIARAIHSALASTLIDEVIVSTEDSRIADEARAAGAAVVTRPDELSGDTASSESALLHALGAREAAILVFVQATSPFIDSAALDSAIDRVRSGREDVVFAAVETHGFLWRIGESGATGVNHDGGPRIRRQDLEPQFLETGAFYVMRADGFRQSGSRFFGRIGIAEVDGRTALEIDTLADLELANRIAPSFAARASDGSAPGGRSTPTPHTLHTPHTPHTLHTPMNQKVG